MPPENVVGEKSILLSIKKMLNIHEESLDFDDQIVLAINSVFMNLNQLGVGPVDSFYINSKSTKWEDFLPGTNEYEGVKAYVYLKVRQMFDPPQNSFLVDAIDRQALELEWRLIAQAEEQIRKEVE